MGANYHDTLGNEALAIALSIRDEDPQQILDSLTRGCASDPHRMAQIIMALAAFTPVDEPHTDLVARVMGITHARVDHVLQAVAA
ncbi:hypothetical protein [Rhodococcus sp. Leaf258]|uniref:hypothetical protein n=1 Tax=Rhodococcus sp. Leaf258 TaxID=1736310 RepID=UPI000701B77C|nr:hypothetical protein [Rhodococcus sp. Leaf258]KQU44781.1 hypothetical protein ASH03_12690 [Rhodococcus sp. Leaf258]